MTIVFLTPYFFPEKSSSDFLLLDVINKSTEIGNTNIVLCPNPVREVSDKELTKYQKSTTEIYNSKTTIHRVKCSFNKQNNYIKRVLRAISINKNLVNYLKKLSFDIVVVPSSPPLLLNHKLHKIVKSKNAKIIYNIHDIYPDNSPNKKLIYNYLNRKQIQSLKYSDLVLTLSNDMKNTLNKKIDLKEKIKVIGTWPYEDMCKAVDENELTKDLNLNKELINVFYIGNIGEWQNIDLIIKAFKYVDESHAIHIVGGGRIASQIAKMVEEINSPRLSFHKRKPVEIASKLYEIADANLVTLNKGVIFTASPSKTPQCLKANRPIIAAVDKDSLYGKMIVTECNGSIVDPDDYIGLATEINLIRKNTFVNNDKSYNKYYEKQIMLDKWMEILK